jgi:hypothetical protein
MARHDTHFHRWAAIHAVLLSILVFAAPLTADIITFTDRDDWEAATRITTHVTFDGIAEPGESVSFDTEDGLTFGGISFVGEIEQWTCNDRDDCWLTGHSYQLDIYNPGNSSDGYLIGPDDRVIHPWGPDEGYVLITPPNATTSFGVDLGSDNQLAGFNIIFSDGHESFAATDSFFGAVTETPIAYIVVTNSPRAILDNFAAGTAIPEAGTIWAAPIGLLFFVAYRYRHRYRTRHLSDQLS